MQHGFYLFVSSWHFYILIIVLVAIVAFLLFFTIYCLINNSTANSIVDNHMKETEEWRNRINKLKSELDEIKRHNVDLLLENNDYADKIQKYKSDYFNYAASIGFIAILAAKGMTQKRIAEQLNLSATQVNTRCKKYNIKTRGMAKNESKAIARQIARQEDNNG